VLQDAVPRLGREHPAGRQQWRMAGVGCTEGKAQAHELPKVLNGQGKLIGSMATIRQSQ
jgi:hypothetical protein